MSIKTQRKQKRIGLVNKQSSSGNNSSPTTIVTAAEGEVTNKESIINDLRWSNKQTYPIDLVDKANGKRQSVRLRHFSLQLIVGLKANEAT